MQAPLTLFIWSKTRILPVRLTDFSITEEAFDPNLNPIRAKVSLGMRVLNVNDVGFDHKAGSLFMIYQQRKEQLATMSAAGSSPRSVSEEYHDRSASGFLADCRQTGALPPNSRYHDVETAQLTRPDGRTIVYLRRRFVPPPERFALVLEHTVVEGDRLDNLAAKYLGDPEQFWRICDANGAINPDELTENVGSKLRITLPEGIPATTNA